MRGGQIHMEEAKGRRWAGSGEYTSGSEGMYTEVEEAFFFRDL